MDNISAQKLMDNAKIWHSILENIKSQISAANFRTWFSNTALQTLSGDKLIVSTPSAFVQEQLSLRYLPLIESSATQVLGSKTIRIEFSIDSSLKPQKKKVVEENEDDEGMFQTNPTPSTPILNPKFTLENFVVGLTNNVAYAAAQAITQNPGTSYNPLFIYGGTGVGKTHLMLGVGNAILKKYPHIKITYCSSEKFTNDYVEAIRTNRMGDLRAKYRSNDLLLIDDIQFLSGKEGTQEEFFHTFNELQSQNKQIVLTSDKPPHEIAKLEERLKSRFQGGLMVDIQLPDFETRVAILKAKCQERAEVITEEALTLIAHSVESNARELEGKLIQILQVLKIQNLPPTADNIKQLLGQKPAAAAHNLTHKQVLGTICNYFNIKLADLTGPKRQKELVLPRHLAMHILSEDLKMTVEKIGDILGGRDHTTVMHGRDKIKKLITTDREVQRVFIEVKNHLANPA